jgi:hypothetical protein
MHELFEILALGLGSVIMTLKTSVADPDPVDP